MNVMYVMNFEYVSVRKFWKHSDVFRKLNEFIKYQKEILYLLISRTVLFTNFLVTFWRYYYPKVYYVTRGENQWFRTSAKLSATSEAREDIERVKIVASPRVT